MTAQHARAFRLQVAQRLQFQAYALFLFFRIAVLIASDILELTLIGIGGG